MWAMCSECSEQEISNSLKSECYVWVGSQRMSRERLGARAFHIVCWHCYHKRYFHFLCQWISTRKIIFIKKCRQFFILLQLLLVFFSVLWTRLINSEAAHTPRESVTCITEKNTHLFYKCLVPNYTVNISKNECSLFQRFPNFP